MRAREVEFRLSGNGGVWVDGAAKWHAHGYRTDDL